MTCTYTFKKTCLNCVYYDKLMCILFETKIPPDFPTCHFSNKKSEKSNVTYRIVETIICGNSTFEIQYKKSKWWWFGWESLYETIDGRPMTYSSYDTCLRIIDLHKKDGTIIHSIE